MCSLLCSALSDSAVCQCCATVLLNSAVLLCCATVLCYSAVVLCYSAVALCCALPLALLCCAMPCRAMLYCESFSSLIKSWIISTVMSFNFLFFLFSYVPAETLCCYCNVPLSEPICVTQNAKLVTLKGIVEGTASIYCTVLVQKYCSMLLIKLCQHKNKSRLIIILDFRHLNTFFP